MSIINRTTVTLALIAGAGYFAYGRFMPHGGGWGNAPGGAPPVSVAEVIERHVQQWREFSGRMVAVDMAEIRPRVSGTIEKVHFADGAMVKKGDILFTIDQRPYIANLQAAKASYTYSEAEYKRASSLLKDKATPKRDADEKFNAFQQAKAALTRAELDMDYTTIRAPFDGRVSRAEITEGNLVETNTGAPVLTTIVSSNPIYADFEVDENTYLQYAKAGSMGDKKAADIPVLMGLASETDAKHKGRIESFDNRLSSASGTIRVRATFDNADGTLVPGLFARIKLGNAEETNALLITDRAIGTDQNKKFVIVVGANNKTEHREVKLGTLADGLRVVNEGLKPGEKIIVNGLQRVMMPGQPVAPETVPMDAKDMPPLPDAAPNQAAEPKTKDSEKKPSAS